MVCQAVLALITGLFVYASPDFSTQITIPFFKNITPDFGWGYIIFAAFVIVGASNAVNLTDGLDGLAILLITLVAFITLLVMIFSLDYVRGDRRYTHFFAAMTLFSGGMLIMVMSENMVQLILGWEIMGLTSFMLIGHWWEEEANSRAALKAFFTVHLAVALLVALGLFFPGFDEPVAEFGGARYIDVYAPIAIALGLATLGFVTLPPVPKLVSSGPSTL